MAASKAARSLTGVYNWSDRAGRGKFAIFDTDQAAQARRYDKLAVNYLAFVKLGSIRIWLRANESTP